jgi:hypothetical protein
MTEEQGNGSESSELQRRVSNTGERLLAAMQDPRCESGVPDGQRMTGPDFVRMTGLARPEPDTPEPVETPASAPAETVPEDETPQETEPSVEPMAASMTRAQLEEVTASLRRAIDRPVESNAVAGLKKILEDLQRPADPPTAPISETEADPAPEAIEVETVSCETLPAWALPEADSPREADPLAVEEFDADFDPASLPSESCESTEPAADDLQADEVEQLLTDLQSQPRDGEPEEEDPPEPEATSGEDASEPAAPAASGQEDAAEVDTALRVAWLRDIAEAETAHPAHARRGGRLLLVVLILHGALYAGYWWSTR